MTGSPMLTPIARGNQPYLLATSPNFEYASEIPKLLRATGQKNLLKLSWCTPISNTLDSARTGTPRAKTNTAGPYFWVSTSARSSSSGLENRDANAGPQRFARMKPIIAPTVNPVHEAHAAISQSIWPPPSVLTTLDGIGKKISPESNSTMVPETIHGSSVSGIHSLIESPKKTKGMIGIARTIQTGTNCLSSVCNGVDVHL